MLKVAVLGKGKIEYTDDLYPMITVGVEAVQEEGGMVGMVFIEMDQESLVLNSPEARQLGGVLSRMLQEAGNMAALMTDDFMITSKR